LAKKYYTLSKDLVLVLGLLENIPNHVVTTGDIIIGCLGDRTALLEQVVELAMEKKQDCSITR
jgi:hypothetical protein